MFRVIIIVWVIISFSCKKKEAAKEEVPSEPAPSWYELRSEPLEDLHMNVAAPSCSVKYSYRPSFQYTDPRVNPNNHYEFCFLRIRNGMQSPEDCDLFTFNIETGHLKLLASHVKGAADWSSTGWILFTGVSPNQAIFKIKANGDSLTKLIDQNSPQEPRCSPDGKAFVFYCGVCHVTKLADLNGVLIRSFTTELLFPGWKSNTELLYYKTTLGANIDLVNHHLLTNEVTTLSSIEAMLYFSWDYDQESNVFLESNAVLRSFELGNSKSNILKTYHFITSSSSDAYNRSPNFSHDRIISQRVSSIKLLNEECSYEYRSDITVMDADGTNERRLLIPEN